jgi:DNA-binding TFAR19-related protein (PDSD5 family)
MTKLEMYVKRLQTVQNMTEDLAAKELAEILMDILEDMNKNEMGFKAK